MTETAQTTAPAQRSASLWRETLSTVEKRDFAAFAVATLAAWAHTIDEVRIGEFIAVPFGIANAALVAAWPRLGDRWRATTSILFGLLWALAVVPYHVVPLLGGTVTGQHVSGLFRVVGGLAMVVVGIAILRRRNAATDASPPR